MSVYPHDEMRIRITTVACLPRKHTENQNKRRSLVPQWAPNKPWFISQRLIRDSETMSSRLCVLEQRQYNSIKQTGQHTYTMTLTVAGASVSVHAAPEACGGRTFIYAVSAAATHPVKCAIKRRRLSDLYSLMSSVEVEFGKPLLILEAFLLEKGKTEFKPWGQNSTLCFVLQWEVAMKQ